MGIADWKRGYGSGIADCIDGSLFNTHRNVQVDAILLEAESDPVAWLSRGRILRATNRRCKRISTLQADITTGPPLCKARW